MCRKLEMSDLYKVLGVSRDASTDEIRSAYKVKARLHHPDREGGNTETFKKIQEAHEVLSDEGRRRMYDMTGSVNEQPGMGPMSGMAAGGIPFQFMGGVGPFGMPGVSFDMGSIFGEMFGAPSGQRGRRDRGPNKHHDIGLPLSGFYNGHQIKLNFKQARKCTGCEGSGAEASEKCVTCKGTGTRIIMQQLNPVMVAQTRAACDACSGEGKRMIRVCRGCQGRKMIEKDKQLDIRITPGMREGEQVTFSGECSDSHEYDRPGDVVLTLRRAGSDDYEWKGDDLWIQHIVTYAESVLGFSFVLGDHPSGSAPMFSWYGGPLIHGAVLQMPGMGMPHKTGGYGNLYVQIKITPPDLRPWTPAEAATLQSVLGGNAATILTEQAKVLTISSKDSILVAPK